MEPVFVRRAARSRSVAFAALDRPACCASSPRAATRHEALKGLPEQIQVGGLSHREQARKTPRTGLANNRAANCSLTPQEIEEHAVDLLYLVMLDPMAGVEVDNRGVVAKAAAPLGEFGDAIHVAV